MSIYGIWLHPSPRPHFPFSSAAISLLRSPLPELSFLLAPYRGWTRAGERRVQDNLHAHAQNAAIFPPQIGGKTIFGSILQIWLVARFWIFWMIIYKQPSLHSDWLKTCQLIPVQWNFISATLNHIRFVLFFFITLSKIPKEVFAKICWQLKTPTRTWMCTRCIMQMSYLYASDFPFKNFCKIAQHTETIRKKCLGKE